MSADRTQREQAARYANQAARLYDAGARPEALVALRQAVLLYAAADDAEAGSAADRTLRRARADACQRCGDCLAECGEHAEAANVYQEATDLYRQIGDVAAEGEAAACAHKIMESVDALRARPQERLYLLIARYERQQRQLTLQSGTAAQQAQCCMQIARIFQRRERPEEAIARYREALSLYARATQAAENLLACAECHHRMATLLAHDTGDLRSAVRHYRQAIALYTAHEPPVYGVQESRTLCERALAETEAALNADGPAFERFRE
jgi:tetratricopeptide (TPR) repeat protein